MAVLLLLVAAVLVGARIGHHHRPILRLPSLRGSHELLESIRVLKSYSTVIDLP